MANYQSSYTGSQIDTAINKINTTTIPTKVSDLANDSHFVTSASLPTKVSDLTNDSNFTTSAVVTNLINSNVEYKTGSAILNLVFNAIYPIGCYYWSSESTDPGTLFGGTWEPIQDTFILAAGSTYTAGNTGGEATHTLTLNEAPAHTHGRGTMDITGMIRCYSEYNKSNSAYDTAGVSGAFYFRTGTDEEYGTSTNMTSGSNDAVRNVKFQASKSWTGATDSKGGGTAHNNMPPYIVAYCWHRTA